MAENIHAGLELTICPIYGFATQDIATNLVTVEDLIPSRERFLRYIRARVSDPTLAEDILQDGLLKAIRAAPHLRNEELLVPWFYRVLRNAIVDTYRRRNSAATFTQLSEADTAPTAIPEVADLCDCFRDLLPTINPDYAVLIESELAEEPTPPAILATELGISVNNLKVRRHRARQALRKRLEETCRTCTEHGCMDCTCR